MIALSEGEMSNDFLVRFGIEGEIIDKKYCTCAYIYTFYKHWYIYRFIEWIFSPGKHENALERNVNELCARSIFIK